jgi:ankyrin repeat protein
MKKNALLIVVALVSKLHAEPDADLTNSLFCYGPEAGGNAVTTIPKENVRAIKKALAAGANVNATATTNFGRTVVALSCAAQYGYLESAKILINSGADVNFVVPDDDGSSTPLISAVSGNNPKIVQLILKAKKFNPERQLNAALKYAKEMNRTSIIKLLQDAGAK